MHRVQPSESSSSASSGSSSRVSFAMSSRSCAATSWTSSLSSLCASSDAGDHFTDCEDGLSVLDDLYDQHLYDTATDHNDENVTASQSFDQLGRRDATTQNSLAYQHGHAEHSRTPTRISNNQTSLTRHTSSSPKRRVAKKSSRAEALSRDFGRLLSQAWSLDLCFCGNAQEEDSIYCSRACAQADALAALEGGSQHASTAGSSTGGGDESRSRASYTSDSSSVRSSVSSSGASSHYRRVVSEEERRRSEERALAKERSKRSKSRDLRTDAWSRSQQPQEQAHYDRHSSSSDTSSNELDRVVPPPRSSSKRVLAASAFPASSLATDFPSSPATEVDATPRAPRVAGTSTAEDGYDGVPSLAQLERQEYYAQYGHAATDSSSQFGLSLQDSVSKTSLGLRMLQRTGSVASDVSSSTSSSSMSDGRQRFYSGAHDAAWAFEFEDGDDEREMDDRVMDMRGPAGAARPSFGHKKGKLSFDDVVGILNG